MAWLNLRVNVKPKSQIIIKLMVACGWYGLGIDLQTAITVLELQPWAIWVRCQFTEINESHSDINTKGIRKE